MKLGRLCPPMYLNYGKRNFSCEGILEVENAFKLSKSAKEFRCQIYNWNGPACMT